MEYKKGNKNNIVPSKIQLKSRNQSKINFDHVAPRNYQNMIMQILCVCEIIFPHLTTTLPVASISLTSICTIHNIFSLAEVQNNNINIGDRLPIIIILNH